MKRLLPGIAIAASIAWGCGGRAVEIPTFEVGGAGGARLMNGAAKTPAEAYENAYSQLTRAHYNVRRNLDGRSQNQYGAREAMKQIVGCLETMRACIPPADRSRVDPYVERYSGWVKELDDGTWGGSFLTDFDRTEREVKSTFSPASVALLAEFPAPPAPDKTRRPADAGLVSDTVEVPVAKTPPAGEAGPPKPAEPPPDPAASQRALYKAWSASHDDLVAGYKEKKACRQKYEDVIAALRLLKAQLKGERADKLQIYIDYYGGVDEKTKGFSVLPEKTSDKDIVDELEVAARVIRKEFNPDK